MIQRTSERAGRFVEAQSGPDGYYAFVPAPLAPDPPLAIDGRLQDLLDEANQALGRLDGVTLLLPDPGQFLYSYVRKEAVLSSQIEGTQSSLSDLLLFENEAAPGVPLDDVVETSNYIRAMTYGLRRIESGELPLSNHLTSKEAADRIRNPTSRLFVQLHWCLRVAHLRSSPYRQRQRDGRARRRRRARVDGVGAMGLFSRLINRAPALSQVTLDAVRVDPDGSRVEAVGESHYLDALIAITGRRGREQVRHPVVAALICEPDNPYDAHAVAVHVDGRKVGHLSRDDARAYQPVLLALARDRKVLACNALVCGREATPNLGVFLDLPAPDDILNEVTD